MIYRKKILVLLPAHEKGLFMTALQLMNVGIRNFASLHDFIILLSIELFYVLYLRKKGI